MDAKYFQIEENYLYKNISLRTVSLLSPSQTHNSTLVDGFDYFVLKLQEPLIYY